MVSNLLIAKSQYFYDEHEFTLLDIEAAGECEWFEKFDKLDDSLAQVLLLIALMRI